MVLTAAVIGDGLLPAGATTSPWTATGPMTMPRSRGLTATPLQNGQVLVVGGHDSSGHFTASAELYDPAKGTWRATGSLSQPRGDGHTATLLSDGRVLVTGGECECTVYSTARTEIYNPLTEAWTETAPMSVGRAEHTATLLADGRVLVTGGWSDHELATGEIYDPGRGSWSSTGTMLEARMRHSAALLPNGRVLVGGGWCDGCTPLLIASAELFDPRTNSFSATSPMKTARAFHTYVGLPDGRVVVAGGWGGGSHTEIYHPTTGKWSGAAPMMLSRLMGVSLLTAQGQVLMVGGSGNNTETPITAESYDPATDTWSSAGYLSAPRRYFAGAALPGGGALIAGGYSTCYPNCSLPDAEVYDGTTSAIPYPPSKLRSNTSDGTITFGWNRPVRTGGGPLTGYTVRVSSSEGTRFFDVAATDTTLVLTGLTNGVKYSAWVAARNAVGSSFWSHPKTDKPAAI